MSADGDGKYCVDCAHARIFIKFEPEDWQCGASKSASIDLLTGEENVFYARCREERAPGGSCGVLAVHWKPK